MNKKIGNVSLLTLILEGCALLMGALFLFMFLGRFIYVDVNAGIFGSGKAELIGNDLAFGDYAKGGVTTTWVLALLAVIASCAACVLSFVKAPKICLVAANGLAGLLLLVAAIMVFCTVPMAEADGWQLGVGAIFAGIFGIIGAVAACGASFFTFKK